MNDLIFKNLEEGILEIRMNRPQHLNALNPSLIHALLSAFQNLQNDRQTRVVIFTGEGNGFCAGADMQESVSPGGIPGTEGMGTLGFVYKFQEHLANLILAIHECDKPIIAAIHGAAVGGGLGLALASDIRIASEQAKFGAVAIKAGLSAADVGTSYFLPRFVGAGIASELMLTGRIFKAQEAAELRLVSKVVPFEELETEALKIAQAIAKNSEYGVWMTKKTLRSNLDASSLRQALELENRTQVLGTFTGGMSDAREAFAKGQSPVWKPL